MMSDIARVSSATLWGHARHLQSCHTMGSRKRVNKEEGVPGLGGRPNKDYFRVYRHPTIVPYIVLCAGGLRQ
jgi:hypothetical protein